MFSLLFGATGLARISAACRNSSLWVRYTSRVNSALRDEWEREFDAAARRPLRLRFRYAFIHTYKPVLDDARFRSFDTMSDYRKWCAESLPSWLGYGPSV